MATVTDPDDYFTAWQNGSFTRKILIEGDSWVSHPLMSNLARQFDKATNAGKWAL